MAQQLELLDIQRDYIFKLVFGAERNKKVLISLLNAILKGDPQVHDIKILNPEIPKIFRKGKTVRLDIRADIGDEKYVDIEIQVAGALDASDRAVQYLAAMLTEHSKSKKHLKERLPEGTILDYRYPKVIGIWIFANTVTARRSAINKAQMTFEKNEVEDYEIMTKKARIIFIELPKFHPKKPSRQDMLNAWLAFLKDPNDSATHKVSEEIEDAFETLKVVSVNEKIRRTYQSILDKENDILIERSRAVQIARDEERAKAEVEKKELTEKAEAREKELKIETAKNALSMGLTVEQVAKITGLSTEEIQKLS